jgi:hypothetical protein
MSPSLPNFCGWFSALARCASKKGNGAEPWGGAPRRSAATPFSCACAHLAMEMADTARSGSSAGSLP